MAKKINRFEGVLGEEPLILPTGSQADEEIVPGNEKSLSASEERALARCEQTIERARRAIMQAGEALTRIRDLKLYRVEYSSFEAYCAARWGYERAQAYRIMGAYNVIQNLTSDDETVSSWRQTLPTNEAQTRPLVPLKTPEEQRTVWGRVVERAEQEQQPITAKFVERVVKEVKNPQPPQLPAPASEPADLVNVRFQVPKGTKWIAIRHLVEALGGEIGNEKDDHNPTSPLERAYARISLQNIQNFINGYRRVSLALEEYDEAIQRARREKTPSPLLQPLNEIAAALEQMREDMVE